MTVSQVRSLYERRPYPHYPLLATPRWQDGYLGYSRYARLLAGLGESSVCSSVLSVGSGEILPFIIRKWEAASSVVTCVDLSQRSISRAKFRCRFAAGRTQFLRGDINEILEKSPWNAVKFGHIEAYGVLHHISNTSGTISRLARHLDSHGTMRIMVYNARARDWIWQANRAFRLLGLTHEDDRAVEAARHILLQLAKDSNLLGTRLKQMGSRSLENNSRFADTFLHPWESRQELAAWLAMFNRAGLIAYSLFDRYAELDDLPNPLWRMPTAQQLTERALDLRFENNLEIWLCKKAASQSQDSHSIQSSVPFNLKAKMPPSLWQRFPETKNLSLVTQWHLWQGWLHSVHGLSPHKANAVIQGLPLLSAQRLARIGAITLQQARECGLAKELERPIHDVMEAPVLNAAAKISRDFSELLERKFAQVDPQKIRLAALRFGRII